MLLALAQLRGGLLADTRLDARAERLARYLERQRAALPPGAELPPLVDPTKSPRARVNRAPFIAAKRRAQAERRRKYLLAKLPPGVAHWLASPPTTPPPDRAAVSTPPLVPPYPFQNPPSEKPKITALSRGAVSGVRKHLQAAVWSVLRGRQTVSFAPLAAYTRRIAGLLLGRALSVGERGEVEGVVRVVTAWWQARLSRRSANFRAQGPSMATALPATALANRVLSLAREFFATRPFSSRYRAQLFFEAHLDACGVVVPAALVAAAIESAR